MPRMLTLVDLLRSRALDQPQQQLYTFLQDGETEVTQLTYAALDRRARAIGAYLQQLGAHNERVLLIYPPGLDFVAAFFGCLYAGSVAVPVYPPTPGRLTRTLNRLQSIVTNAQPRFTLTTTAYLPVAGDLAAHDPAFEQIEWIDSTAISDQMGDLWQDRQLGSDTLAFLQYTSGSTAASKGVMLSHGNLMANLEGIRQCFEHSSESRGVIWLPPYHDMGLIGGILQPLYANFPVTLMAPVAFLQQPYRWLQAISTFRGTTSGGPNFAYELCIRKITPEQRETLDLSSWRVAFNGAEPVRAESLERFATEFACCGFRREAFYPCYGLAEATLIVTGGKSRLPPTIQRFARTELEQRRAVPATTEDSTSVALVGCGQSLHNQQILIVDPDTLRPCMPNQIGEIWVSGPSVAQGYWHQAETSQHTFQATPAGTSAGSFLRTGDLGLLYAGELFISGRIKDLIIIRGRNHYPQDIEHTIEQSHPHLRSDAGAAFTVEIEDDTHLVVVHEVERQVRRPDVAAIASAIRQAVAVEHDLHVHTVALIRAHTIPKTTSGKIQRRACCQAYLSGQLKLIEATLDTSSTEQMAAVLNRETLLSSPIETRTPRLIAFLRSVVAQALSMAPMQIDPDQPLQSLGIDSLMAVELQHRFETDLGVVIQMSDLLAAHSLRQLVVQILDRIEDPANAPFLQASYGPTATYPLSYGQQALWFLHQLAPTSSAYHIAHVLRIEAEVDRAALHHALQALVMRHPALRTTYVATNGRPEQRVAMEPLVHFESVDAVRWDSQAIASRVQDLAQQPFDLEHGPLLRVYLLTRSTQEHMLLLVMHHIVTDFWSLAMLAQELGTLYHAELTATRAALPPLRYVYSDYVQWQYDLLGSEAGTRLEAYWQRQLASAPLTLNLPTDRPRPPLQTYHGASQTRRLNHKVMVLLKLLAQAQHATLYMTLLAAFATLLHRYTNQADLLIGSPTTGRSRAEFAKIVGYFVNPIVLRIRASGDQTFQHLMQHVRQTVLESFNHQEYPFPVLAARMQPDRDPSRSPIFQAMFAMYKAPVHGDPHLVGIAVGESGHSITLGGLELEPMALAQQATQFELTMLTAEVDSELAIAIQYNTDLFEAATIQRMLDHFETLIGQIVADPTQRLSDLALMTEAERHQVLVEWNATQSAYPVDHCIHQLFEAQATRTPHAIAIVTRHRQMTYEELDTRSEQLARYLRQCGVGPEIPVGLGVERSPELIVGMLGIWKAGGIYVPLDPTYPAERLSHIFADANLRYVLTQDHLREQWPTDAMVICLDQDWLVTTQFPTAVASQPANPDNAAYIIYTSGSTGRPKGVLVPHRGLCNVAFAQQRLLPIEATDRLLQIASLNFDASIAEILMALCTGASLYLEPQVAMLAGADLVQFLRTQAITAVTLTPSVLATLPVEQLPALTTLMVAGEACSVEIARRWSDTRRFFNLYGPTEATIWTTIATYRKDDPSLTIGYPITNTQGYVLDQHLNPVPVGVAGELYIGGLGVARGYLNRPDLTAERFVPNPFNADPGTRLYRTGDLVRYVANGAIEFLGRIDQQIKLRGFRIEPGEIEATLARHPAVHDAAVVMHEGMPQGATPGGHSAKRLVAYIVRRNQGQESQAGDSSGFQGPSPADTQHASPSSALDSGELRAYLQAQLPAYMIPSAFVVLDALPLTPNGKLDRAALPAPGADQGLARGPYVGPRTPVEEALVVIWQEVLSMERIGVHDNFFALGGHSLLATQAISRVRDTLDVELPLHCLFEHPTVADLAEVIIQMELDQVDDATVAEMQMAIEGLSADEIDTMLAMYPYQSAEESNE